MEEVAICEKGTSTEYLIEWRSWTTTLDTLRKDNFLRWLALPVAACPMALRTCNVLNSRGCWLLLLLLRVQRIRGQGQIGTKSRRKFVVS